MKIYLTRARSALSELRWAQEQRGDEDSSGRVDTTIMPRARNLLKDTSMTSGGANLV